MAAPQVAGTAAAPAVTAESHGLDAILTGDLSGEGAQPGDDFLDAMAGNAPADIEGVETEATEPEAESTEQADKAQKLDDEVIFSDEALATPEGIKKGRERIKQLRRMTHEKYLELKNFEGRVVKRHGKLKASVEKFVSEKRNHEMLLNNVRANLQATHSNDPELMIQGLDDLYGMNGIKTLKLLNSHLIHKGRAPLDPQIQVVIDA